MTFLPRLLLFWLLPLLPALAADHAVILMYHHVDAGTPPSTSVTPAQFESHLDYLAAHDYQVWPLAQVVAALRGGEQLPDRVVALTFDDAYVSIYKEAWPRLRARGWPFTVFVATDAVDQGLHALMSWAQIRELAQAGVTFANHSGSHDHLVRRLPGEDTAQWRARVRADIGQAQTRLQQELGSAPMLFAWPYGEYDTGLLALVQELGYTAFGQQSGPAGRNADPRALPRYPVAVAFAGLDELRDKLSARPLPVQQATPSDPVLPVGEARPLLTIQLQPGGYRPGTLACYVSGQGRVAVQWQDAAQTRFAVQAAQALPVGRSRYNCTAQATDGQGWLWFSQPWIRRNPDGSWYRE